MTDRLLPYYNRELEYLRRFGAEFAREHPKIAGRLRLGDDLSEDPHVSRIIEAFALLAARTRLNHRTEIAASVPGRITLRTRKPEPRTATLRQIGRKSRSAGRRIVAAGVKRMAFQQPHHGQNYPANGAAISNRFDRVLAAAGREPAAGRKEGADPALVKADQPDQQP